MALELQSVQEDSLYMSQYFAQPNPKFSNSAWYHGMLAASHLALQNCVLEKKGGGEEEERGGSEGRKERTEERRGKWGDSECKSYARCTTLCNQ